MKNRNTNTLFLLVLFYQFNPKGGDRRMLTNEWPATSPTRYIFHKTDAFRLNRRRSER